MRLRQLFSLALLAALSSGLKAQVTGAYPINPVPFTSVKFDIRSFLGERIRAAKEVTIPLAFSKCQSEGRYRNFERAAKPSEEYDVRKFMGFPFDDTDVYKTIEGASYVLQTMKDERLRAYVDSVLDIVAKAQEPDGYLYTARTINPKKPHSWSGKERWVAEEAGSHELYNLGHMVDAACAHYQATGSDKFLNIAKRYADCVIRAIGPGKDQKQITPGHQIAEMALARLYVLTKDKRYLDEAKFLLSWRGKTPTRNPYSQSHKPVTEQDEAVGHAVRAGYMYAGMADVAALTGDTAYVNAIDRIWENIVSKKYYITGGVGARHQGEAFGENYELPNLTAYNETCAAISMVYLGERMFLLHGEGKYIDFLERTLYNGVLSGMSIDGGRFFYPNPLEADGHFGFNNGGSKERQPWFGCACCPSNLCRFIPSLPGYMYGAKDQRLYVNLFGSSTSTIALSKGSVTLSQKTGYPWAGDIEIGIDKSTARNLEIMLRIPGWARGEAVPSDLYAYQDEAKTGYSVTLNGKKIDTPLEKGYLPIRGKLKKGDKIHVHFDMPVHLVKANDKVKDDRNCLAIERGPLVYCAESMDNAFDLSHFILDQKPTLETVSFPDLQKQMLQIKATGSVLERDNSGKMTAKNATLRLLPYYAWNHRGIGQMRVWIKSGI